MGWYCTRCGHAAETPGTCPRDAAVLDRVSQHDLLGRPLGEYTVLAMLGGGSYGTVYRAVHARSGNLVAIKLLHASLAPAESQRVLTEARAAATIAHPNVVQVYDLAMTSERRPYIVMKLLDGRPLSRLLETPLASAHAVALASDVLRGLAAAHARGIVHRDLKPDNIFVAEGRAIIVDFGLAKLIADPFAPQLTVTGETLGTPHYMAPEQIRARPVDGRADLYAIGCVLYQMIAGRPPFDAAATFLLFDAHVSQPPVPLATLVPDVPPHVAAAVERALAKHPDERFANADAMRRALAGVRPHRAPASARRRTWAYLAAATAIALVIGAIGVVVTRRGAAPGSGPGPVLATPKPGGVVLPPRLADEPENPAYERALEQMHDLLVRGLYTRDIARMMLCRLDEAYRTGYGPADYRSYLRRLVVMLRSGFPDLDLANECDQP